MALSVVLGLVIFGCYLLWEFAPFPDWAKKCLKMFVDASPLFVWLFYRSAPSFVFLLLCFVANMVIFSNEIIGACAFVLAYGFASVFTAIGHDFELVKLLGSAGVVLALEAAVLLFYKENRIGVAFYGFTACLSCIYAFLVSLNVGFLFLVIADMLLIVNEIHSDKRVFITSDFFYFLGLCMVPLSLA